MLKFGELKPVLLQEKHYDYGMNEFGKSSSFEFGKLLYVCRTNVFRETLRARTYRCLTRTF